MRKRWLSILLVLCMVLTLVPVNTFAYNVVSGTPNPSVEYGYSADVKAGSIRYVSQNPNGVNYHNEYWGSQSYQAKGQCGAACTSMALSYLGVNMTPEAILNMHNGTNFFDLSLTEGRHMYNLSLVDEINNYLTDQHYSPVVIHVPNYSENGHFLTIIAKTDDTHYQVLDPWDCAVTEITLNGNNVGYDKYGNWISDYVDDYHQWYNENVFTTITFDPNGGTCDVTSMTIDDDGKLSELPIATRDGYIFAGWYLSDGDDFNEDPITEDYIFTSSTTLYARWATIVESGTCGENLTWTLDSTGLLTISGTGEMINCDMISLSPFYDIASNRGSIRNVVIEDGVTSIGSSVFYSCTGLTNISIPSSVNSIGDGAFHYCPSLTNVTLPKSVTSIGHGAFSSCASLTEINVDADNKFYQSVEGVLLNKSGTELICCPGGKSGSIKVPSSVTSIGDDAFSNCPSLENVTIPDSVVRIGCSAFECCFNLKSIVIPDSITRIENCLFFGCRSLTSVTIPDSVTSIDFYAFLGCSKLSDVYYLGSQEQWNKIIIDSYNDELKDAVIHYNVVPSYLQISDPESIVAQYGDTARFLFDLETKYPATLQFQYSKSVSDSWHDYKTINVDGIKACYEFTVPADAEHDSWFFRCVVTDERGHKLQSGTAMLAVERTLKTSPEELFVSDGETVMFYTDCQASDASYQWQYRTSNNDVWANCTNQMEGYNSEALYVIATAKRNGYQFRCVVTYADGTRALSTTATLYMQPLTLTSQPVNYTGKVNSTATFSVSAEGDGLTYQWQISDDGGETWTNSSVKNPKYSTKLTAAKDGRMVRCIVSDQYGNSVTSDAAVIKLQKELSISTQPKSYTGKVNSTAKFTVKAVGDGLTYQWQISDNGGKTWSNSSVKAASYSTKLTAAKDGRMVRCIVTDQYGVSVTSSAASMTISKITITTQPKDYVGKVNSTAKFTVSAEGNGLAYQWQISDDDGVTWSNSSVKAASYSTKLTAAKNGRMVRCIVTDAVGNSVTSSAVSMKIG